MEERQTFNVVVWLCLPPALLLFHSILLFSLKIKTKFWMKNKRTEILVACSSCYAIYALSLYSHAFLLLECSWFFVEYTHICENTRERGGCGEDGTGYHFCSPESYNFKENRKHQNSSNRWGSETVRRRIDENGVIRWRNTHIDKCEHIREATNNFLHTINYMPTKM